MFFSFASVQIEKLMLPLLWQLALIILSARLMGLLFRKIRQPEVVGEIFAGLLLGPSFLGALFPEISNAVFRPEIEGIPPGTMHWIFVSISQIGLIMLLFLVGMEFEFGHLKELGLATGFISLAGIVVPFTLGIFLSYWIHPKLFVGATKDVPFWAFALFLGTAMSITALPILGRMLVEWNLARTRIAVVTITAAAFDDAAGWILLAGVAAFVGTGFEWSNSAWMILQTLLFGLVMIFVVRPLVKKIIPYLMVEGEITVTGLGLILVLLFLSAIATNLIGIFAIFGAFLFGACLCDETAFRIAMQRRLRDFVTAFFLPVFFAYTGLRTKIGTLDSMDLWVMAGVIILASVVGKIVGCGLASRLVGFNSRESTCIGVLMNTRALMELIVINLGKDMGVIPDSVFCTLVMMALITTYMTTPLIQWLGRGTELKGQGSLL